MTPRINPETIIETIGGCGRFQKLLCIIIHLMTLPIVASMFLMVFSVVTPKWYCNDAFFNDTNWTEASSVARVEFEGDGFKMCKYGNNTKCRNIVYDQSMNTIVNEWNMACESSWIPSMIASMHMGGLLVGNAVSGQVADSIGRKKPLFMSFVALMVANLIAYFATGWPMFAVARVLCGFSMGWYLTLQFSMTTETTLSRMRPWVISFDSWTIANCTFCLVAYLVPDWRTLHLVIAVANVPFLATWCFIPESFRWLLSHNRRTDAKKVIQYIAKFNSQDISDDAVNTILNDIPEDESGKTDHKKYTPIDLFRTRQLLNVTLLLCLNWFTLGLVSYGIKFGIQAMSGNFFLNSFLLSAIGFLPSFVSIWMSNRFGRRYSVIVSYAVSSLGALLVGVVQYIDVGSRGSLSNAFVLLASLGIGMAWGPVPTLTMELYPTVVRNIGYGSMNIFARLGATVAPPLALLDTQVPGIMYFLSGVLSIICIVGTTCLTETRGRNLNDRIQTRVI